MLVVTGYEIRRDFVLKRVCVLDHPCNLIPLAVHTTMPVGAYLYGFGASEKKFIVRLHNVVVVPTLVGPGSWRLWQGSEAFWHGESGTDRDRAGRRLLSVASRA
jgi:hypothetical protein